MSFFWFDVFFMGLSEVYECFNIQIEFNNCNGCIIKVGVESVVQGRYYIRQGKLWLNFSVSEKVEDFIWFVGLFVVGVLISVFQLVYCFIGDINICIFYNLCVLFCQVFKLGFGVVLFFLYDID